MRKDGRPKQHRSKHEDKNEGIKKLSNTTQDCTKTLGGRKWKSLPISKF